MGLVQLRRQILALFDPSPEQQRHTRRGHCCVSPGLALTVRTTTENGFQMLVTAS